MDEEKEKAILETATQGLNSLANFANNVSPQPSLQNTELTNITVSDLKKLSNLLHRKGHARFRRNPNATPDQPLPQTSTPSTSTQPPPPPPLQIQIPPKSHNQPLTLDFTKPYTFKSNPKSLDLEIPKETFSFPSLLSSAITGDGSVSNGRLGPSQILTPAVSSGKPPLSPNSSFMSSAFARDITGDGSVSNGRLGPCPMPSTIPTPAVSRGKQPLSSISPFMSSPITGHYTGEASVSNGRLGPSPLLTPSISRGKQPLTSYSSFMSSAITGDRSVSSGRIGPSYTLTPAVSGGKPPLSSPSLKKSCHNHSGDVSGKTSASKKCHCQKRKNRNRRQVRVPCISSRIADIPADEYSWRKYGSKPIKGTPHPRGYYRCTMSKNCPARKRVEKAKDDPNILVVTYEFEHRHHQLHNQAPMQENNSGSGSGSGSMDLGVFELTLGGN